MKSTRKFKSDKKNDHKKYRLVNPSMRKAIFRPIDFLHKSEDFGPKLETQ